MKAISVLAVLGSILSAMVVPACGSSSVFAAAGTEGAHCYGNGSCNDGLVCLSDLCVAPGTGAPGDDGGPNGQDLQSACNAICNMTTPLVCRDDSGTLADCLTLCNDTTSLPSCKAHISGCLEASSLQNCLEEYTSLQSCLATTSPDDWACGSWGEATMNGGSLSIQFLERARSTSGSCKTRGEALDACANVFGPLGTGGTGGSGGGTGGNPMVTPDGGQAGNVAGAAGAGGCSCGDGICSSWCGETQLNCPSDCGTLPVEDCRDGVDNDGDGMTDCSDADCTQSPDCLPPVPDAGQGGRGGSSAPDSGAAGTGGSGFAGAAGSGTAGAAGSGTAGAAGSGTAGAAGSGTAGAAGSGTAGAAGATICVCGDGVCDDGCSENHSNCPEDCNGGTWSYLGQPCGSGCLATVCLETGGCPGSDLEYSCVGSSTEMYCSRSCSNDDDCINNNTPMKCLAECPQAAGLVGGVCWESNFADWLFANICTSPPNEMCDDAIDNDGDGATDCDDADCYGTASCLPTGPDAGADSGSPFEDCDDGLDNDVDGLTDCADPDCHGDSSCDFPPDASITIDTGLPPGPDASGD